MSSVSVRDLHKSFSGTTALDGVSFEVNEGELFGIIGPDGAGKTTLFRIMVTLLVPDSGEAMVDGLHVVRDFKELRPRLGYMPGRFSLYADLSVQENLSFFATIFGTSIEENYDLIRDIYQQIEPFKDRRAGALSGGMKQKLALSCALIHRPTVLFLDEPTTGVDAVSRREFWDMLAGLRDGGLTIVVSTPYMDEAVRCDRVALIQSGKLLEVDTPGRIEKGFGKPLFGVRASNRLGATQDLRFMTGVETAYPFGEELHVTASADGPGIDELTAFLIDRGHAGVQIRAIEANIEDVFMDRMIRE